MSTGKRRIDVMVSSTTNDLGEHRRRLSPIITQLLLTPRMMDNDSATGKDGLTYSLDLVDEAEVYILLLGFRYGYVPDDPLRNPDQLSMTHLEYRRAKQRQARLGWINRSVVTLNGPCTNLPVIAAPRPPQPIIQATQAPVSSAPPVQSTPAPAGPSFTCNCSKTCEQMVSCDEAYFQLRNCGCGRRDGDGDGVPCETICPGG